MRCARRALPPLSSLATTRRRSATTTTRSPPGYAPGRVGRRRLGGPERLGREAVEEAERAIFKLGLKAINLEPGFGAPARAFDDRLLWPSVKPWRIERRRYSRLSGHDLR